MDKFTVEFYENEDGDAPAKEFLLSLDIRARAKMTDMISLLQDNGNDLREPYSKFLSDGIFELRVRVEKSALRILYFFYLGKRIILTNGFVKKSNKTPGREIAKAKRYRAAFLAREEAGKQDEKE